MCSSVEKAKALEIAFEDAGKNVIVAERNGKKVSITFKSVAQAIILLDKILKIHDPRVADEVERKKKMVKSLHLKKFVDNEVSAASGISSASYTSYKASKRKAPAKGTVKNQWKLECPGVPTTTWRVASQIIPSILFDEKLGDSEAAKKIKKTLKTLVKEHMDENKGNQEWSKDNVKKRYANWKNYRAVLTKLMYKGVCDIFEDSVRGNIQRRGKGKGQGKGQGKGRSASVGTKTKASTSRTLKRKKPKRVLPGHPRLTKKDHEALKKLLSTPGYKGMSLKDHRKHIKKSLDKDVQEALKDLTKTERHAYLDAQVYREVMTARQRMKEHAERMARKVRDNGGKSGKGGKADAAYALYLRLAPHVQKRLDKMDVTKRREELNRLVRLQYKARGGDKAAYGKLARYMEALGDEKSLDDDLLRKAFIAGYRFGREGMKAEYLTRAWLRSQFRKLAEMDVDALREEVEDGI